MAVQEVVQRCRARRFGGGFESGKWGDDGGGGVGDGPRDSPEHAAANWA